jgi:hypothetical protein
MDGEDYLNWLKIQLVYATILHNGNRSIIKTRKRCTSTLSDMGAEKTNEAIATYFGIGSGFYSVINQELVGTNQVLLVLIRYYMSRIFVWY